MRFHDEPDLPRPERFLSVSARCSDTRRVVLDVVGEVDAFTAPLLRACVRTQLARPGLRELILDMGGVEFLGAAGVSAVAEAGHRCRQHGVRFRLRSHGRRQVTRSLQLAGVVEGLGGESEAANGPELRASFISAGPRTAIRRGSPSATPVS